MVICTVYCGLSEAEGDLVVRWLLWRWRWRRRWRGFLVFRRGGVFQQVLREEQGGAVELAGPFFRASQEVVEELGAEGFCGGFGVVEGGVASGFSGIAAAIDELPLGAQSVHHIARGAAEFGLVGVERVEEGVEFWVE